MYKVYTPNHPNNYSNITININSGFKSNAFNHIMRNDQRKKDINLTLVGLEMIRKWKKLLLLHSAKSTNRKRVVARMRTGISLKAKRKLRSLLVMLLISLMIRSMLTMLTFSLLIKTLKFSRLFEFHLISHSNNSLSKE